MVTGKEADDAWESLGLGAAKAALGREQGFRRGCCEAQPEGGGG